MGRTSHRGHVVKTLKIRKIWKNIQMQDTKSVVLPNIDLCFAFFVLLNAGGLCLFSSVPPPTFRAGHLATCAIDVSKRS